VTDAEPVPVTVNFTGFGIPVAGFTVRSAFSGLMCGVPGPESMCKTGPLPASLPAGGVTRPPSGPGVGFG
jgi:hypothetical protein